MDFIEEMKNKVLRGEQIDREEALRLSEEPSDRLREAAEEIRRKVCGDGFDICTIVNAKCGRCSEDCKYCAQSAHYQTACDQSYPLLSAEELLDGARRSARQGVLRYSIVTSGRRLSDAEVEQVCGSIHFLFKSRLFACLCFTFLWLGNIFTIFCNLFLFYLSRLFTCLQTKKPIRVYDCKCYTNYYFFNKHLEYCL